MKRAQLPGSLPDHRGASATRDLRRVDWISTAVLKRGSPSRMVRGLGTLIENGTGTWCVDHMAMFTHHWPY